MKAVLYLCTLLLAAALPACCQDCGDIPDEPEVPTRTLAVHVSVDGSLRDYRDIEAGRSESMLMRFTAVASRDTEILTSTVSMVPDFTMDVPEGVCALTVFADYIPEGSAEDFHFFTDIFEELLVKNRVNYQPNVPSRVAYYGRKAIVAQTQRVSVATSVAMAQYRLVASDRPDYEVGNVRISFNSGYPAAIDGLTGDVCRSWGGLAFNAFPQAETIAADMVFADSVETVLNAKVEVYDTDGKLRARIQSVDIPVVRGGVTNVRGPFYTTYEEDERIPDDEGSGIQINPEFASDIVIKI